MKFFLKQDMIWVEHEEEKKTLFDLAKEKNTKEIIEMYKSKKFDFMELENNNFIAISTPYKFSMIKFMKETCNISIFDSLSDFLLILPQDQYREKIIENLIESSSNKDFVWKNNHKKELKTNKRLIDNKNDSEEELHLISIKKISEAATKEGYKTRTKFPSGREYREHQKQAVLALAYNRSSLLGDQVGLGKGGEFIGGLLTLNDFLKENGKEQNWPCVISVPKSLVNEMVEEIRKWVESPKITKLTGTKSQEIDKNMQFIVLNHDILSKRLDDILQTKPKAFIADEAHVYKNIKTKRTKAAIKLSSEVVSNSDEPYIVMASGTPFLNSPNELWPLIEITKITQLINEKPMSEAPESVYIKTRHGGYRRKIWPQRAFEMYFCDGKYDKYGIWSAKGATNTKELHKLLLKNGMIRRRKRDVISPLPILEENIVNLEVKKQELEEYWKASDSFKNWAIENAKKIAKEEGISEKRAAFIMMSKLMAGEAIMRLTTLRQELAKAKINSTVNWIHDFMSGYIVNRKGEKVKIDEKRKKLIVFVHHKNPRKLLVEHPELEQYGIVTILAGDEQKGSSIQKDKELFQKDPSKRLMICSMAAREGHTLTASYDIALMEIPFVPSWVVQMAGRSWARFSEDYEPHEAYLHYLIIEKTEDEKALKRVKMKKDVFDAVIDGQLIDESNEDLTEETISGIIESLDLDNYRIAG